MKKAASGALATVMNSGTYEITAFDETTAGETVSVLDTNGESSRCTLGALVNGPQGVTAVSAGHCGAVGATYRDFDPDTGETEPLGRSSDTIIWDGDRIDATKPDVTLIPKDAYSGPYSTMIGGRYTVIGVADPEDITPETEICKYGSKTRETCGLAMGATKTYIRTGPTTVKLVGFLSGSPNGNDYVTDFTLAKPVFEDMGLSLL